MTARFLGLSALVVAAIAAAGVGGYVANRPDPVETTVARSAAAPAETAATSSPGLTPASAPGSPAPVSETEGIVAAPASPAAPPVERERAASTRPSATPAPAPEARRTGTTKPAPRPATPAEKPAAAPVEARTTATPPPATSDSPRPGSSDRASTEPVVPEPARETRPADERAATVVEPPPPPTPRVEEYIVPSDSVIGLQLDETISSDTARVEQRVDAHVARDVRVNGAIVIPAGTKARGQITVVEPGGKFRERARLGVRFHTLVLADGTTVPIQTEAIFREGDQVGQRSAARIGGSAVGGAIIGAIFGGGKGAAIGAAAGAGAGTAATMATQKSQVTLHAGSTVTVRLTSPTTVNVEHQN